MTLTGGMQNVETMMAAWGLVALGVFMIASGNGH